MAGQYCTSARQCITLQSSHFCLGPSSLLFISTGATDTTTVCWVEMPGIKHQSRSNGDSNMVAGPSKLPVSSHFNTLDRENGFRHPSKEGSKYPAPQQLVAPHIDSFDALFEGAPIGPNNQVDPDLGLLDLAISDLQPKVIFDGQGQPGTLGNRLERKLAPLRCHPGSPPLVIALAVNSRPTRARAVKIDSLAVARPMASAKGPDSRDRLIYPTEVSRWMRDISCPSPLTSSLFPFSSGTRAINNLRFQNDCQNQLVSQRRTSIIRSQGSRKPAHDGQGERVASQAQSHVQEPDLVIPGSLLDAICVVFLQLDWFSITRRQKKWEATLSSTETSV